MENKNPNGLTDEQGMALIAKIKPQDRVTCLMYGGRGLHGVEYVERSGKAVMPSSVGGWVLDMGGKYGTPGLVDNANIVRIGRKKM